MLIIFSPHPPQTRSAPLSSSRRHRPDLDPQRLHHAGQRRQARIAAGRERLVKRLARDARLAGKLGHSQGARHIAESRRLTIDP